MFSYASGSDPRHVWFAGNRGGTGGRGVAAWALWLPASLRGLTGGGGWQAVNGELVAHFGWVFYVGVLATGLYTFLLKKKILEWKEPISERHLHVQPEYAVAMFQCSDERRGKQICTEPQFVPFQIVSHELFGLFVECQFHNQVPDAWFDQSTDQ